MTTRKSKIAVGMYKAIYFSFKIGTGFAILSLQNFNEKEYRVERFAFNVSQRLRRVEKLVVDLNEVVAIL